MAPTTRRTNSSASLKATRTPVARNSSRAPASDHSAPANDQTVGKTSAELKLLVEEARGEARMLEKMAAGSALGEVTKQAARLAALRVKELEQAIEQAEATEQAAAAAAARRVTNKNTELSRKYRERKAVVKENALAAEEAAAEELRKTHTELRRITADDFEDEDAPGTYENGDTLRKMQAILDLVDSTQFGVVTTGMIKKHVFNADGSPWGGETNNTKPIRDQLKKMKQSGELTCRSYRGPRPSKQGFAGKESDLWARSQRAIDLQIADWRRLKREGWDGKID